MSEATDIMLEKLEKAYKTPGFNVEEWFKFHCFFCGDEFDCAYNTTKHEEIVHAGIW